MARRIGDSTLVDLWQDKQRKEEERYTYELALKRDQLEFDKQKFQHQKEKETKELELRKLALEVENEEKKSQIVTQKLLMEMLLKKL